MKYIKEKINLSGILFLAILVGFPIVSGVNAVLEIKEQYLSVAYRAIVLICAIIVLISTGIRYKIRINYNLFIGIGFIFFYILRMLFEWLFDPQASKLDWDNFWVFLIAVCVIPAIPYGERSNIPSGHQILNLIVAFGVIGLILNFYSATAAGNFSTDEQLLSGRLETERLNPISYGHLGVTVTLLSLWSMLIWKDKSILTKLNVIIGVLGIVASGSRGPLLSFACCMVVLSMRLNYKTLLLVLVVILMATLLTKFVGMDDIYFFNRISESMFEDASRKEIFNDAFDAFRNNVFFGSGYPFETYPHNLIIEAFSSSGIVAGFLLVSTIVMALIMSSRLLKDSARGWLSLLFMQYLLSAMVSGSLYYSNIFWTLLVCVTTAGQASYKNNRRQNVEICVK